MCWRSWNTFLDLMAVFFPFSIDQLGLGLHHQHGESIGADLHVLDIMKLGAYSLGYIMTIITMFDNNTPSNLFLITVSFECRNANIFSQFNIVQVTFVVLYKFDKTWTMRFHYMLSLSMGSVMLLLTYITLRVRCLGSVLTSGTMILMMSLMMSLVQLMMYKRLHLLRVNTNYWQDADYENLELRKASVTYVCIYLKSQLLTRGGNMVASREELNNNSEASLTFSIYTPVYSMSVQSPVQHHGSGAAETHAPFPCHDRTRASEGI